MRNRPFIERSATAAILLLAVVLAWMIADRAEAPPAAEVVEKPSTPAPAPHLNAPSPGAIAAALAVELVEIAEPPPNVAAAPEAPTHRPAPQVAARPSEPAPSPPAVIPAPVIPAPEPPQPEPVQEIVPLRPTPSAAAPEITPTTLPAKPEAAQARDVVPLKPTPSRAKPEPPVTSRPTPREEPIESEVTPLRPTPAPPKREPDVMRVQAPAPRPAAPKPSPAKEPAPVAPAVNVAAVMGEGRAFLKILEQGAGPGIEIRWPSEASQRDRLYGALVQCLGMRTGLLDGDGRLYLAEGQKGQPSVLDGERYSGFVRRPEGAIARAEEQEIGRVRSYHHVRPSASAARIFPRRVDAYLIGGLRRLVGDGYLKTKSIRATYRLVNGRAVVDSIVADGRRIAGVIDLSDVASRCS